MLLNTEQIAGAPSSGTKSNFRSPDWSLESFVQIAKVRDPATLDGVTARLLDWEGLTAPWSSLIILVKGH